MKRVLNLLPTESGHYGHDTFNEGFAAIGYLPVTKLHTPTPEDLLLLWNRTGPNGIRANHFEAAGGRVLVAENGYFGKHWRGSQWYALALTHHNTLAQWATPDPSRWRSFSVELSPWREPGGETVILAQRGIGEPGIQSPTHWHTQQNKAIPRARVRLHPGKAAVAANAIPLELDLVGASEVLTWASAAAMHALVWGIPVYYGYPKWIGAIAARRAVLYGDGPFTDDACRLAMFENLAWHMWRREEVKCGAALSSVLGMDLEHGEADIRISDSRQS